MEDSMSSTNHKNKAQFSGDELELSSEDSSWSSYFENSVSSNNVEDTVTSFSSESSSIFTGAAASVKKTSANDCHVASARSAAKRRKMRASFIDDDLEDTATSPVCNCEVKDLDRFHMNLQDTGCSSDTLPTWQHGKRDYGSLIQETQNTFHQTRELTQSGYIMKDINYTGLKEKGLCLVPVSLLFPTR